MAGGPSRIAPIPTLPIFFKLGGRRVLLAGGSAPAAWKAELLAAAGAAVLVCDPEPSAEMEEVAAGSNGAVELRRRAWAPDDLSGAALAIGALEGEDARAFRAAARAAGTPVNIVDVPPLCDFQFGTIAARPPLVIALSTDGAAPVFGQALRTRIEAILPEETGSWAEAARDWRPRVTARGLGFAARRRFWEVFSGLALGGTGGRPTEEAFAQCLDAATRDGATERGRLLLVGLGPGTVEDITLRAVRALQSAETIVYQADLDGAVLALARREARRVAEAHPVESAALLLGEVERGRTVAWAAAGDPDDAAWAERRRHLPAPPLVELIAGLPGRR